MREYQLLLCSFKFGKSVSKHSQTGYRLGRQGRRLEVSPAVMESAPGFWCWQGREATTLSIPVCCACSEVLLNVCWSKASNTLLFFSILIKYFWDYYTISPFPFLPQKLLIYSSSSSNSYLLFSLIVIAIIHTYTYLQLYFIELYVLYIIHYI